MGVNVRGTSASETTPVEELACATAGTAQSSAEALAEQARKLEQLNSWFEVALNNMARGLSMFSPDKRLIVCNAIYREIYELPEHLTVPGTHFIDIISYHVAKERRRFTAEDRADLERWLDNHVGLLAEGKRFSHTQSLRNGRTVLVTYQPLADGGWVDIQEDVTDKRRTEERFEWMARHDPLTSAANRFHFRERLDVELTKVGPGNGLAIHWIDLDRFKPINDTLGHLAGDTLLKAVAKRLISTVREFDFVARLGGDEFAVIQSGLESPEQAEGLAKRLLRILNAPYSVHGHAASIGASIGIVVAPEHGTDAEELMKKADLALYRVKSSGRGSYEVFRPDCALTNGAEELEAAFEAAVHEEKLELNYQPIVDINTREITGCEALMRWRHPSLGMVPPSTFIPIAEKSGLIVRAGNWALRKACSDAAHWPATVKVTVNLSAVQFEIGDPYEAISNALFESDLAPERLEIEITESALLREEERTKETLERIRALGVKVVLDDFGTAFASLSYLQKFRFDKIKIDRSFVRDISERRDCAAIVNAVTGLARALEIGTVAEGIETADQLAHVSNIGCREVQGYFFSRPVPAEDIGAAFSRCYEQLSASASPSAAEPQGGPESPLPPCAA